MTIFASEALTSTRTRVADDRDQIMAALAVAETIVSLLPVMPFHLDTNNHASGFCGKHGVRAMLPSNTLDFGAAQAELGGVLSLEIEDAGSVESRRLMLAGWHFGVPFQVSSVLDSPVGLR
ncbi:hypothetical protein [Streptacidiphilus cavernicola]|uniref:Uncharacterized protein n=1 Tax=Streptacidiphilus cavernicola TaxID=3342716 RepID=A0ABV6W498_9ACTN